MMTRERWVLIACIAASSLVGFDVGMVPIALPQIQEQLGADLSGQLWIGSGFLLTLGAFLLVGGALGDVLNRWRVFLGGVLLFGAATVVSAVAPSTNVLIIGRFLQGFAAALFVPAILASLRQTFEGQALKRALGRWTAWTSLLAIAGPPVAGLIVDFASWRIVFALEVVLVIGVAAMIWRAAPDEAERDPRPIDWVGALLLATSIGGLLYALIEGPVRGWGTPTVIGAALAAVILFTLFIAWEARVAAPLLPLRLFRIRAFSGINLTTFLLYAVFGATGYIITLFLQQVSGYSPFVAGFAVAPTFLVLFLGEEIGNRYVSQLPARLSITIGIVICVAANFLYLNIRADATYFSAVLPGAALYGLGLVLLVSPLTTTALASVPQKDAGVASGVNNAIARISSAIGLAILGVVLTVTFAARAEARLPEGTFSADQLQASVFTVPGGASEAVEAAFIAASEDALHAAIIVCGIFVILGGIVCYLTIPTEEQAQPAPDGTA